jgi:uncharacterized membrane protein YfcA
MSFETISLFFLILLFAIAFLYSSVGHGGASGYLALMALFSMAPETMRPTALVLNIFVAGTGFIQYYRGGHFRWSLFWPFAIASVPAAFIGGLLKLDPGMYKIILGILLLFSVYRLLIDNKDLQKHRNKQNLLLSVIIGAVIGLISGMIGIGGGIILSPVILLLHWGNMKQTAAVSALFILINSISGLTGMIMQGVHFNPDMVLMVIIAFFGGLAGSYIGSIRMSNVNLKRLLAVVLLLASVKLLFA